MTRTYGLLAGACLSLLALPGLALARPAAPTALAQANPDGDGLDWAPHTAASGILSGLASADAKLRAQSAAEAGRQKLHAAVPLLLELLRDPAWPVRTAAARALGSLGAREAMRQLIVAAQTDENERVRIACAEAVKRLDAHRYLATLGTSDPPPVRREAAKPLAAMQPRERPGRAVVLTAGGWSNVLRFTDATGAHAGAGLRWGPVGVHFSLGFPAMVLLGELRLDALPRARVSPFAAAAAAISYNNGSSSPANGPAASLAVGGGLRFGPAAGGRLFGFIEALACWVLSQPTPPAPPGGTVELRTLSVPVLAGLGMELWP